MPRQEAKATPSSSDIDTRSAQRNELLELMSYLTPAELEELDSLLADVDPETIRAETSLHEFVRQAWSLVESAPFIDNWHIGAICEHLQATTDGEIQNLVINIPPGCSKSLLVCVFWPMWEWARDASVRWFFASYDQRLSTRDSVKCRTLLASPWYRERWGKSVVLKDDQNQKTYYETNASGYRLATSVGGHGTGEHPDRIVVDDAHSAQAVESDAARQSVTDWWDLTMSTRGVSRQARRVIVGQRLHERDLPGHVLEQGGYEHICLPMRYEHKAMPLPTALGWQDPRTAEGELLTPRQFSDEAVSKLERTLGSYGASGQLQQRPSPAGGGIWQRGWWRFYDKPPEQLDEVIMSWDMAFKDLVTSDWVVGQVWGRAQAVYYLLDQVRRRLDMPGTLRAVEDLWKRWPQARAKLVEDKANGPAVIAMLKTKVPGLIAVNPQGGKMARAQAASPVIESGNVYLPERRLAPWVDGFIEEAAAFPNGAHDDQVDAASQALLRFLPPRGPRFQPKSFQG